MKKLVSLMLVFTMMLALALTPALALENEQESKMSDTLSYELSLRQDDNILGVSAVLNYEISEETDKQLHDKTALESGYTLANATTQAQQKSYLAVYNKYLKEYQAAENLKIAQELGIDTDKEYQSSHGFTIYLVITKEKTLSLSLSDMIKSMEFWGEWVIPDPDNLFEKLFLEKYSASIFANSHKYEELYYHYDENGEMDWALVYECSYNAPPWNYHIVYKDRILKYGTNSPFSFGYAVYDVKTGEFYDIIPDEHQKNEFDSKAYDGLDAVVDGLKLGFPIGDADLDHNLTVMDATYIQRVLAKLQDFKYEDSVEYYYGYVEWSELNLPKYVSDINCDGERDILDAVSIQQMIARLEL